MNKLLDNLEFREYDCHDILDVTQYNKIKELKQMNFTSTPLTLPNKLLEQQQDPKLYAQTNKIQIEIRSPIKWQPSQSSKQFEDTNAVSVIESSKALEESSTSFRRKIQIKGRVQKQPTQESQILKLTKTINKIVLYFKDNNNNNKKIDYGIIIRYEDASNQLEWNKCDKNNTLSWDTQIKFKINDEIPLHILVIQLNEKQLQQTICQQSFDVSKIEGPTQLNQDIELKYLKNTFNGKLMIDIQ